MNVDNLLVEASKYPPNGITVSSFIGDNGSGKSNALMRLSNKIQKNYNGFNKHRVHVLSNVVTDPFRLSRTLDNGIYNYLGLRQASNTVNIGIFSKTIAFSLIALLSNSSKKELQIFRMAGFEPGDLEVEFKLSNHSPKVDTKPQDQDFIPDLNKNIPRELIRTYREIRRSASSENYFQPSFLEQRGPCDAAEFINDAESLQNEYEEFYYILKDQPENSLKVNWRDGSVDKLKKISKINGYFCRKFDLNSLKVIEAFFRYNQIGVTVKQQKKIFSDEILLTNLSAGQEIYLSTFLRVVTNVSDGDYLLIDEPEIGIHPEWQQNFVGNLREILKDLKNVTVVIATHSPLIVGDSDKIYRFSSENQPVQIGFEGDNYTMDEIYYQCFGTRTLSSMEITNYLAVILDWLTVNNGKFTLRQAEYSVNKVRSLAGDSPPIKDIIKAFDARVGRG